MSCPRPTTTTTTAEEMEAPTAAAAEVAGSGAAGATEGEAVEGTAAEAGISLAAPLREEVYELEVLELGGQGGGELGAVARLAHAPGDLQESPDGAGERDVAAP